MNHNWIKIDMIRNASANERICKCSMRIASSILMTTNCCEETKLKCEKYCWISRLKSMLLSNWITIERVKNWMSEKEKCRRALIASKEITENNELNDWKWYCNRIRLLEDRQIWAFAIEKERKKNMIWVMTMRRKQ